VLVSTGRFGRILVYTIGSTLLFVNGLVEVENDFSVFQSPKCKNHSSSKTYLFPDGSVGPCAFIASRGVAVVGADLRILD